MSDSIRRACAGLGATFVAVSVVLLIVAIWTVGDNSARVGVTALVVGGRRTRD